MMQKDVAEKKTRVAQAVVLPFFIRTGLSRHPGVAERGPRCLKETLASHAAGHSRPAHPMVDWGCLPAGDEILGPWEVLGRRARRARKPVDRGIPRTFHELHSYGRGDVGALRGDVGVCSSRVRRFGYKKE